MNMAIKNISSGLNIRTDDVLKLAYDEIEQSIASFREEVRLAKNVETLEFLRRNIWDKLFAVDGCYYDLCKRSPMLKILRLNADIRYCDVLKKKKQNEAQEIAYNVIKTTTVNVPLRKKEREKQEEIIEEVDGELMENEIVY
jgi:Cft2 family RNA processing exonuclease